MFQKGYSINLIDSQDKDLIIESVATVCFGNKKFIEIHVFKPLDNSNTKCIKCNSKSILTQAYHIRKIKFLPIAGLDSYISYKQHRFLCKSCHKTFNESTSIVTKNSTISNRTKKVILSECKKKQSAIDFLNGLMLVILLLIMSLSKMF